MVAPTVELAAQAATRLVFKRKHLEQACAARTAFRCAIPIAEACSPAPRRTSLRPNVRDYAAGESMPAKSFREPG